MKLWKARKGPICVSGNSKIENEQQEKLKAPMSSQSTPLVGKLQRVLEKM